MRRLGRKVRRAHNAAKLVESTRPAPFDQRLQPSWRAGDRRQRRRRQEDRPQRQRLGRYVVMQDVYGNRYTYAHLGEVSKRYPVPKRNVKQRRRATSSVPAREHLACRSRRAPASAGRQPSDGAERARRHLPQRRACSAQAAAAPKKERLFANPAAPQQPLDRPGDRPGRRRRRLRGLPRLLLARLPPRPRRRRAEAAEARRAGRRPARSSAASASSTDGPGSKLAPHLNFSIRPAGRGAPRIDPKPILDGWKLLEATAVYRAAGRNPFLGPNSDRPMIGQILLMSKEALARRVLANPRIDIYDCGRADIRSGQVDRRVLATLEFLAASGLRPTVTSLKCGHGFYTASGNVSEHSSGNAVDIAKVNGIPILGHQGAGSITEFTDQAAPPASGRRPARPDHLADGHGRPDLVMADHADHIHVGFRPLYGPNQSSGDRHAACSRTTSGTASSAGSATSATRSCGSSLRSTRSRSSAAIARAGHTRATERPRVRAIGSSRQLFRFCQLDFSFPLGPADGRYLARARPRSRTSSSSGRSARRRRSSMRGRRPKRVESGAADPSRVDLARHGHRLARVRGRGGRRGLARALPRRRARARAGGRGGAPGREPSGPRPPDLRRRPLRARGDAR